MRRIAQILGIGVLSVLLPWWLVLPVWGAYAYALPAYELIVIGLLLDAYHGTGSEGWYYTVAALVITAGLELLKPHLSFYEERTW